MTAKNLLSRGVEGQLDLRESGVEGHSGIVVSSSARIFILYGWYNRMSLETVETLLDGGQVYIYSLCTWNI